MSDRGWGTKRELLVVARPDGGGGPADALDGLLAELTARGFVVTARMPPRLALVLAPAAGRPPAEPAGSGGGATPGDRDGADPGRLDHPGGPERPDGLDGLAGLVGVFADEPPAGLRESFEPAEHLFVDAWLARGGPKPPRRGEGERWDAEPAPDEPPRLPPDPPARP